MKYPSAAFNPFLLLTLFVGILPLMPSAYAQSYPDNDLGPASSSRRDMYDRFGEAYSPGQKRRRVVLDAYSKDKTADEKEETALRQMIINSQKRVNQQSNWGNGSKPNEEESK